MSEPLQESVGAGCCDFEFEGVQDVFFHRNHLLFVELILTDTQEVLQAGWIDFFIL